MFTRIIRVHVSLDIAAVTATMRNVQRSLEKKKVEGDLKKIDKGKTFSIHKKPTHDDDVKHTYIY